MKPALLSEGSDQAYLGTEPMWNWDMRAAMHEASRFSDIIQRDRTPPDQIAEARAIIVKAVPLFPLAEIFAGK